MKRLRVSPHGRYPIPLPSNVSIGKSSLMYNPYAFLHYHSKRDLGIRIGHNTRIDHAIFDIGPSGEVDIGDYCFLPELYINTNKRIVIEDYALFSYSVVLADTFTSTLYEGLEKTKKFDAIEESILVGKGAWVGAKCILLGGTKIGHGAIVGAGSVIDFNVPPFAVVAGNPAKIVGFERPRETAHHKIPKHLY